MVGCGECGHRWEMSFEDYVVAVGLTCPKCGSIAVAIVLGGGGEESNV